jgi:hypothetical protein
VPTTTIKPKPAANRKEKSLAIGPLQQGGYAPAIGATAQGLPKEIVLKAAANGQPAESVPVYYFTKDLIRVGSYVHPVDHWHMDVTTQTLDGYVAIYQAMKAAGIKVPFVVDHSDEVDDGRGEVLDIYREGDVLFGLVSVVGEDAIVAVARVPEVSVSIDEIVDGKGVDYGEGIEHVSHSQYPVVPDQKPFVPVAASRRPRGQTLFLSAAKRSPVMTLKEDLKAKLQKLAIDSGKTVDEVAALSEDDLVTLSLETLLGAGEGDAPAPDSQMGKLTTDNANLSTQVQQLTRKLEAKPAEPPAPNEEVLHERGIRVGERVSKLVAEQKLDTATGQKLLGRLTKLGTGKPHAFMLSRHEDAKDCEAMELLDIIAGNNPPPKGEKSHVQARELNRHVQNEDDPNKAAAADGRKQGEAYAAQRLRQLGHVK